jgi:hypothetical protein
LLFLGELEGEYEAAGLIGDEDNLAAQLKQAGSE